LTSDWVWKRVIQYGHEMALRDKTGGKSANLDPLRIDSERREVRKAIDKVVRSQ